MTWTCPRCDRSFGVKRAHVCEPGLPVEVRLEAFDEPQRKAAEKILAIVRKHRDLIIEAVGVGIFVKRARNVLEL
ncbi:MAG TPA: hypothetical protein VL463_18365, partial [Kofleriaceae bacterium]|nr:hypothetical protein [Kofleriaceae bacterium]